jgi:hypothetical protein
LEKIGAARCRPFISAFAEDALKRSMLLYVERYIRRAAVYEAAFMAACTFRATKKR